LRLCLRLDQKPALLAGPNAQDAEALLPQVAVVEEQQVAGKGQLARRPFRAGPVQLAGILAEPAAHAERAAARPAELGRGVVGPQRQRPLRLSQIGQRVGVVGQAQVDDLDLQVGPPEADAHVGGLQVQVGHTVAVQVRHAREDVGEQVGGRQQVRDPGHRRARQLLAALFRQAAVGLERLPRPLPRVPGARVVPPAQVVVQVEVQALQEEHTVAEEVQERRGIPAAVRVRAVLQGAAGTRRVVAERRFQDGVAGFRRGPELPAAVVAAQAAVVGELQFLEHRGGLVALRAARRQPVAGAGAQDARLQGVGLLVRRAGPDF
jgi:hypothetical protein